PSSFSAETSIAQTRSLQKTKAPIAFRGCSLNGLPSPSKPTATIQVKLRTKPGPKPYALAYPVPERLSMKYYLSCFLSKRITSIAIQIDGAPSFEHGGSCARLCSCTPALMSPALLR